MLLRRHAGEVSAIETPGEWLADVDHAGGLADGGGWRLVTGTIVDWNCMFCDPSCAGPEEKCRRFINGVRSTREGTHKGGTYRHDIGWPPPAWMRRTAGITPNGG